METAKTLDLRFSNASYKVPIGMTAKAFIRYLKDRGVLSPEVNYVLHGYQQKPLAEDEPLRGHRDFSVVAATRVCDLCGEPLTKDCRQVCLVCGTPVD